MTVTGMFVYLIGKKKIHLQPSRRVSMSCMYLFFLLLLFGVSIWIPLSAEYLHLFPFQDIVIEAMLLPATIRTKSSTNAYGLENIVMVPLEPYNACGNRILHISCLRTIIATEPAMPIASNLYPQLCNKLVTSTKHEGLGWQIEDAHCMLCFQVNGEVGALVEVSNKVTERIDRYLLPSESDYVTAAMSDRLVQRIVDRRTIAIRQWYEPFSDKNNGDRAWRERNSNYGNFLWQYGATRLINPFTTLFVSMKDPKAASTASALVIADANALNLDNPKWSQEMFLFLLEQQRSLNVPTIMLGIGIQSEFGSDPSKYKLLDFQRDYFLDLEKRQKNPAIGVRGNLTRIACENSGVSHCITTGCPSLTISTERNLGGLIEQRWKDLISKLARKEKIKLVLVLPKPKGQKKGILQLFLELAQVHEVVVIIQVKHDLVLLQESELGKYARNVSFSNVEQWFNLTESVDLVLTTRIHGGMAGIARATPTVLIPTDFRIQELADAMLIPQLPMKQVTLGGTTDLLTLVQNVQTDFAAFEDNRRRLLLKWLDILKEAELEMNPKLLEVVKDMLPQGRPWQGDDGNSGNDNIKASNLNTVITF